MPKQKFYVVWRGRKPGVYDNWDDCKQQVEGFGEAAYKAYATLEDAEEAFWRGKEEAQPAQAVAGQDDKKGGTPLPAAAPRPYDEDATRRRSRGRAFFGRKRSYTTHKAAAVIANAATTPAAYSGLTLWSAPPGWLM